MKIRVLVSITGLVQGVSFRYHTLEKAGQLGVVGWVRNVANGSVQGCFEGDKQDVMALVDWCRTGPRHARVDEVLFRQEPFTGEFTLFQIKH